MIYIPLCFYFIRSQYRSLCRGYEFTFHYASTLSKEIVMAKVICNNLHSTMLLLYLWRASVAKMSTAYLHSTMLLLYPYLRNVTHVLDLFTFHYASTLSAVADAYGAVVLIYIPLCFYFIPIQCNFRIGIKHLHSTMLLLYRTCRGSNQERDLPFTFHYASTLSSSWNLLCTALRHLHSTMLLLYPTMKPFYLNWTLIYIPLCFYFICAGIRLYAGKPHIYIPLCFYFIQWCSGVFNF